MKGEYRIHDSGTGPQSGRDVLATRLLTVELGDSESFYFGVTMSRQAAIGFRDLAAENLTRLLIAAGLEELERGLRAGIYPPTDGGDFHEHAFLSDDYDRLRAFGNREKECLWQERQPRGYVCHATPAGSDERTTTTLCAGCVVPDSRVICAHLMHPSIHAIRDEEVYERIPNLAPLCNVGKDPGVGAECFLGGKDCAERIVPVAEPAGEPPPDVARRAADEIDYFTLVYRDRYGSRVWTIPQARSISEFFGDCTDAEDSSAGSPHSPIFWGDSTPTANSTKRSAWTRAGSASDRLSHWNGSWRATTPRQLPQ